ncbi:hypothetical protein RhiJN_13970 [Ceratobasidium sp. AG-Ba]|nr:hypothetical protein RhiJN_13970 [Ceratobasidium sp. AG-Ba]QRW14526.1 hypothetical protein RhiLY_13525 [Ceratobasidium sp. AG-Ba]
MYFRDPVILHLSRRDISTTNIASENGRTIAWVIAILIAAILAVAIWCIIKVWGSRARDARAEQELGVTALPPPRPRRFGRGPRTRPMEESLPVYDPNGRPPAFSPTGASLGMPPPAYLPGDANCREQFRRSSPSLASIAEKDEEVEDKKKEGPAVEVTRRASV